MKFLANAVSEADGGALWEALPASYQADVNDLAHLAATKIDPEVYDGAFSIVERIGGIVDSKQGFIVNTQLAGEKTAEQKAELEQALPAAAEFIQTLSSSTLAKSAGLQSFDGQAFFDETVSKLLKQIDGIAQLGGDDVTFSLADLKNMAVKVIEVEGDSAKLETTVPGESPAIELYTKVEDRWIPADMAAEWKAKIAEAKAQLESITEEQMQQSKQQAQMVMGMFDGVLKNLEAASTQESFDQALQGAMGPLMGLMMMGGQMGAEPPVAPSMPAVPAVPVQ